LRCFKKLTSKVPCLLFIESKDVLALIKAGSASIDDEKCAESITIQSTIARTIATLSNQTFYDFESSFYIEASSLVPNTFSA
jgi:hypothetical protein